MDLFDLLDQSGDKDLSNERVFTTDNNKIRVRKSDPYGFWSISFERGQVPDKLKGQYTTFDYASQAVELYLRERHKDIKSISK